MALDGVIFDLDGTLADTNEAHVEAWRRAFESCGYKVPPDRIAVEIGKGGDFLVSAVLGQQAEQEHGDRLRHTSEEAYLDVARSRHFRLMPGARELLAGLRQRGLKLALATSSKVKHLRATWDSLGVDLTSDFDVVANASEAARSKPAPDLVHAALEKLGMFPAQCAIVGDTPYDARASRQAGVVCLAVRCGGNADDVLRQAGARGVWQDPADLLAHLDQALQVASPGPAHWTREAAEKLMRQALVAAREAAEAGEVPDGCVLAGANGSVLAIGHAEVQRTSNRMAHPIMGALALTAKQVQDGEHDLVLASTTEPCPLCTGAAIEAGIDTILYALPAPPDEGSRRVLPSTTGASPLPRVVGEVLAAEGRALLQEVLGQDAESNRAAWIRRFLKASADGE